MILVIKSESAASGQKQDLTTKHSLSCPPWPWTCPEGSFKEFSKYTLLRGGASGTSMGFKRIIQQGNNCFGGCDFPFFFLVNHFKMYNRRYLGHSQWGAATSIWPHNFIHAHARLHNHHQPIPDLPSSQQLATTTVLSVWIHILQITPVNGVIQFVAFGVWLLSFHRVLKVCSQCSVDQYFIPFYGQYPTA